MKDRYIDALIKELGNYSGLLKTVSGFDTVFIGGGTPSVLNCRQTEKLLLAVADRTGERAEFTIECNPGTIEKDKLKLFRDFGVNRLSLGLQSADGAELKTLGRIYSYEDFLRSFEYAREAGFTNINADLMSGLPGQDLMSFENTIRKVAGLKPEHISAYSLIIEPGTAFFDMYGENGTKKDMLPSEDDERDMYHLTGTLLKEYGYRRYEISNYSLPGYECRHNLGYWKGEEYLGIGIGAASYINNARYKNTGSIEKYMACIESGDFGQLEKIREEAEVIEGDERIKEYIVLRLRLTEGIDLKDFENRFGFTIEKRYGRVIEKNIKFGLLEYGEGFLYPTEKGMDLSNTVMVDFLD